MLLMVVLAAAAVAMLSHAPAGPSIAQAADPVPAGTEPVEVPELRTKFSQTTRQPDGEMRTRISAAPLHYRSNGEWQRVDSSLVEQADGTVENRAAGYDVSLPETLEEPVAIEQGGDGVAFTLRGADGDRTVNGAVATFADALPGVDVKYTAGADFVKEDLVLENADAQRAFTFDHDPSTGLTPGLTNNGSVEFVDAAGEVEARVAPPSMIDAAGETSVDLAYKLRETATGWRLGLNANTPWLRDGDRAWPVTVDPTVTFAGGADTYMASGPKPASGNGGADARYGPTTWFDVTPGGDRIRRSMLRFDLTGIPANAMVAGSTLKLRGRAHNQASPAAIQIHRLTRSWTTNATWNRYDGTNPWTTPGGDYSRNVEDSTTVGAEQWYEWGVGNTVADWVAGTHPNNGFLLKGPTEATGANLPAAWFDSRLTSTVPTLDVGWWYPTGTKPQWTYDTTELPDGSRLKVNVATGNLILENDDIVVPGLDGLDLMQQRTYNNHTGFGGGFGYKWEMSGGESMWTASYSRGNTITIHGPGGVDWRFRKRYNAAGAWTGTWITPPEIDATLTFGTGGRMLTFDDTGEKWWFANDASGALAYQESAGGKRITYTYETLNGSRRVKSITDTNNKTYTYLRDAHDYVLSVTESGTGGRVWRYGYSLFNNGPGQKRLATYTNPAGKTVTYDHGTGHNLQRITDADGNRTKITYDSEYRVTSIQRMTNTDFNNPVGPKTTFAYSPSTTTTVVTSPDGTTSSWGYDLASGRVTRDNQAPVVSAAGELVELSDDYVNPATARSVRVRAADAGDGVQSVGVNKVGQTTPLATIALDCGTPVRCPTEPPSEVLSVSLSALAGGRHAFQAYARDATGDIALSEQWSVLVDRQAPAAPDDYQAFKSGAEPSQVVWSESADSALPDGTEGSGTDTYMVRYRIGTGAFTAWTATEDPFLEVPGATQGSILSIETRAVDAVGNQSVVSAATVTIEADNTGASYGGSLVDEPVPEMSTFAASEDGPDPPPNDQPNVTFACNVAFSGYQDRLGDGVRDDLNSFRTDATVACYNNARDRESEALAVRHRQRLTLCTYSNEPVPFVAKKIACRRTKLLRVPLVPSVGPNPPRNVYRLRAWEGLCAAGNRSYKVVLNRRGGPGLNQNRTGASDLYRGREYNCNEAGAWRYLADQGPGRAAAQLGADINCSAEQCDALPANGIGSGNRGWEAHHIVPSNDGQTRSSRRSFAADEAQRYAYACGVSPNKRPNGVWLRGERLYADNNNGDLSFLTATQRARPRHRFVAGTAYNQAIANELSRYATNEAGCTNPGIEDKLVELKTAIRTGNFGGLPPSSRIE